MAVIQKDYSVVCTKAVYFLLNLALFNCFQSLNNNFTPLNNKLTSVTNSQI